jgi:hypothetical protein
MLNLEQNFRNFFGTAALPALDQIFFDQYEMAQDVRPSLFNMTTTDRELKQTAGIDSLGIYSVTGESELAPKDSFNQSYKQNYSPSKYSKAIGISKEMIDDDRHDMISKMVRAMARSAKETQNLLAMNVFNNAFTTQTSWDAVAVISASHPSQIGNQSNSLTAADITYAALATGIQTLRKTQDSRGKRLLIQPKVLLVSEDDLQNALEIVQSPYKAGGANNNINALGANGGLQVISSPYLTDTDAWFVLSDPADHGLTIVDRQGMETRTHEDTLASTLYYVSDFRQAVGCNDWRGIVGNTGA